MKRKLTLVLLSCMLACCALGLIACNTGVHTHEIKKVDAKAATCEVVGNTEYYYCEVCKRYFLDELATEEVAKESVIVVALGHDIEHHDAQAPSCTQDGYEAYDTCKREGCDYTTYNKIAALGHDFNGEETVITPATCTAKGSKTVKCTRCDETTTKDIEIDKAAHKLTHQDRVDATCTKVGNIEYWSCSVCKKNFSDEKGATEVSTVVIEIDKAAHDIEHHDAKAATCTEDGWNAYDTCSRCDYTTKVVIPATHTPAKAVNEKEVAATCAKAGSYDLVVYCSVCKEELSRETKTADKLAHTEVKDNAKAPTCTETGLTEGKHCSVCNEIIVVQQTVKALGHTEAIDKAKAPTCTETGLTEGKHCSVCNEVIVVQQTVKALGHTEAIDKAKAPTCTETGLTEGKHCSVCNEVIVAQQTVDALGHTEVKDNAKAATCTETGLTEGKHCSVCNEVIVAQQTVDALGHTEVKDNAKAPTCTETGLTEGKHCSVCNEVIVAQQTVDALGHTEVKDNAKAATCTETGLTEGKHCSVCNEVIVAQQEVTALGHDEVNHGAQAATCTKDGWDAYVTCSRCDYTTYKKIDALGHTEVKDNAKAATCTETGLTEGKHCSVCNEIIVAQQTVKALGHDNKGTIEHKDATCTEAGVEGGTYCTRCNDGKSAAEATISAIGHKNKVHHEKVDATCTVAGTIEYWSCPDCNKNFSDEACTNVVTDLEIEALGHDNKGTIEHKDATCTEAGVEGGTYCTRCNDGKSAAEATISAIGHKNKVHYEKVEATCTEAGTIEYWSCPDCNKNFSDEACTTEVTNLEIEALGHDNKGTIAHKDATCTEAGVEGGTYCTRCNDGKAAAEATIKALGHDSKGTIAHKDATCTEAGVEGGTYCTRCNDGKSAAEATISAIGHKNKVHYEKVEATCTETGTIEYWACPDCKKNFSDEACTNEVTNLEIAALKHDYDGGVVTTAPTAETKGVKTFTCKRTGCGHTYTEDIDPLGYDITFLNPDGSIIKTVNKKAGEALDADEYPETAQVKLDANEEFVAWDITSIPSVTESVTVTAKTRIKIEAENSVYKATDGGTVTISDKGSAGGSVYLNNGIVEMEYTITVTEGAQYILGISVWHRSGKTDGKLSEILNFSLKTAIDSDYSAITTNATYTCASTPQWSFVEAEVARVTLRAGTNVIKLVGNGKVYANVDYITLTKCDDYILHLEAEEYAQGAYADGTAITVNASTNSSNGGYLHMISKSATLVYNFKATKELKLSLAMSMGHRDGALNKISEYITVYVNGTAIDLGDLAFTIAGMGQGSDYGVCELITIGDISFKQGINEIKIEMTTKNHSCWELDYLTLTGKMSESDLRKADFYLVKVEAESADSAVYDSGSTYNITPEMKSASGEKYLHTAQDTDKDESSSTYNKKHKVATITYNFTATEDVTLSLTMATAHRNNFRTLLSKYITVYVNDVEVSLGDLRFTMLGWNAEIKDDGGNVTEKGTWGVFEEITIGDINFKEGGNVIKIVTIGDFSWELDYFTLSGEMTEGVVTRAE